MRKIAIEKHSRCGCCRRAVVLYTTIDNVTLVEHQDGEPMPHVCPEEAVEAWARVRRMIRLRNRAQTL